MRKFFLTLISLDLVAGLLLGPVFPLSTAVGLFFATIAVLGTGLLGAFLLSLAIKISWDEWANPLEIFLPTVTNWVVVILIAGLDSVFGWMTFSLIAVVLYFLLPNEKEKKMVEEVPWNAAALITEGEIMAAMADMHISVEDSMRAAEKTMANVEEAARLAEETRQKLAK